MKPISPELEMKLSELPPGRSIDILIRVNSDEKWEKNPQVQQLINFLKDTGASFMHGTLTPWIKTSLTREQIEDLRKMSHIRQVEYNGTVKHCQQSILG